MDANHSSSTALFESSIQEFRNSISEEERKIFCTYDSPAAMLEQMRVSCSIYKENSRLLFCCKKIAAFSNAFTPYFDIIEIFVQVKPDWLAWFWGSIKLVFKLGSNYVVFLEKITEMFESMSVTLPQYQRHLDTCVKRPSNKDSARLVQFMSFLYADIIQFCQEICCMFSRGSKGSKLKHRIGFLGEVIWKPFDSRFSELKDRIAKHRTWFDKEMAISDQQLLTQHYEDFLTFLKSREQLDEKEKIKAIAEQDRLAEYRVERIKNWISSTDYRHVFEFTNRQRHPQTGDWLLNTSEYLEWRDATFDEDRANNLVALEQNFLQRMLFLLAKPGYGKTFISGVIIRDLDLGTAGLVPAGQVPPTTAFFHFNSGDKTSSRSAREAFNAIATQLVHIHRNGNITIDALALLITKVASGQRQASADDVDAVLKILLKQYPTFLVIDGVDECTDKDVLLTKVHDLCKVTDCRVLFLSRPNISLPWCFPSNESESRKFFLSHSHNLGDIESYLLTSFDRMTSDDLFGRREIPKEMLQNVSRRANGMFLWAKLLVNYLRSEALSPFERISTISDASLLEGLDGLYHGILLMLGRRYKKEKIIAADIFKWLSTSLCQLNAKALHTALAITPGSPTSELQYISNFSASIPKITCALVEVDNQGMANFIHLSLKEYLESLECASRNPEFSLLQKNALHEHLAIRCLSYLTHDIPKKPFAALTPPGMQAGADTRIATPAEIYRLENSTRDKLDFSFPLLRYATLCWPEHLARSLFPEKDEVEAMAFRSHWGSHLSRPLSDRSRASAQSRVPSQDLGQSEEWRPHLSQFLVDRLSVTTWVEASWTYGLPPKISRLVPLVEELRKRTTPHDLEDRELWWIALGLNQLSEALRDTNDTHHALLKADPTSIWKKEITAATDSKFWPVWDEEVKVEVADCRRRPRVAAGFQFDVSLAAIPMLNSAGQTW